MANLLGYATSAVLGLHGLVHLLGSGVYLGAFELAAFEYETTLLAGAVDVGDVGIRVFGLLWSAAAVGFAASAVAVVAEWPRWRLLLGAVTGLSLLLTGLAVDVAYAGFALNLALLVGLVTVLDGG
jgi:hypothetical protein